jgi:hypothetical protein
MSCHLKNEKKLFQILSKYKLSATSLQLCLKLSFILKQTEIKICFCPQKRMSPPVPQTVVKGKKSI